MNNDFGSTSFVGASPDFLHFVNLCEQVRVTKSKNMKVGLLSRYLSSMDDESCPIFIQQNISTRIKIRHKSRIQYDHANTF